ncbi:ABC transporter substrate-binding protein [bacterium]|nr:MAG: ABC transporter substrate-binding protein [bacterium]
MSRIVSLLAGFILPTIVFVPSGVAAERLIGIHSVMVMAQSLPWIAREAGLLQKHNLDFQMIYIASSPMVTGALLGGDAEIALTGGSGIVRAFVQGAKDLVFVGGVKNFLDQSILTRPEIHSPESLKGKKIGVSRIGGISHYFTIQALRRFGMQAGRDYIFIQTGGEPETLAALVNGAVDAATLTVLGEAKATAMGFRPVVYGPDLHIPSVAAAFVTRRSLFPRRSEALAQFMRAMAEAMRILHSDKEFTYRVLGRQLRISDKKVLETAYHTNIGSLEPKLTIAPEAVQAILDEVAQGDPLAKKVQAQDLIDRRYLDEMERDGFFNRLWADRKQQ